MTPPDLPALKARDLIRALERMGFRLIRQSKGSHWQFLHPDGRRTTVPVHKGQDIGPGLLRKILRDIKAAPERLLDWLQDVRTEGWVDGGTRGRGEALAAIGVHPRPQMLIIHAGLIFYGRRRKVMRAIKI